MIDAVNDEPRTSGEPAWSSSAPKGGKAVIRRMLSETASTVPLFLGQTFVQSLRDVGYNNSVWAVCEHVDNAVQWGAKNIRVYFRQRGRRGDTKIDVLVLDDGVGMSPDVLRVAMSFGGSTVYGRRDGIGRFGVGMKTAALSMGPHLDVISWQEKGAFYAMELDVDDIGSNAKNLVELPEPSFRDRLPIDIVEVLTEHQDYPKDPKDQRLLTGDIDELNDRLGPHGTIVYVPDCDRVTYKQSKSLYEHATREMARIYRRAIAEGLNLYINNKLIEPFDPTYWMKESWHAKIPDLPETRSRLVQAWTKEIEIPVEEGSKVTAPVSVRLYALPIEAWQNLPSKVLKNQLRVYDDHQVSFLRNGREVSIGPVPALNLARHATTNWLSVQIDFDGRLDEAFGVAMTKQGVRPKAYALEAINAVIADQVTKTRKMIAEAQSNNRRNKNKAAQSEAERRAQEADSLQRKPLPETPEELAALEENLRALAITLKRNDETDEEAFQRVKTSRYITVLKHDDYWPFYAVDFQYGKVILTINTAHPFYGKLYKPLEEFSVGEPSEEGNGERVTPQDGELLVGLQMLLLSLARTQSQMTHGPGRDDYREMFQSFQKEWSDNLRIQLTLG